MPPPQFTTRKIRGNEVQGVTYTYITKNELRGKSKKIAIKEYIYDNYYGFFKDDIKTINEQLKSHNVIVDSCTPATFWKKHLVQEICVKSVFFAPRNPVFTVYRILSRLKNNHEKIKTNEFLKRIAENIKNISFIGDFDYHIDTTNVFDTVNIFTKIVNAPLKKSNLDKYTVSKNTQHLDKIIENYRACSDWIVDYVLEQIIYSENYCEYFF